MKKEVEKSYYKNEWLILEWLPRLNKSLRCMRDLGSCVTLENLQFCPQETTLG